MWEDINKALTIKSYETQGYGLISPLTRVLSENIFTLVANLMAVGRSSNQIHMISVLQLLLSRSVDFEWALNRQACYSWRKTHSL